MRLRKTKQTIFLLLTLILIVSVFSFRAYASESNGSDLEVVTAWAYLDSTRSPLTVNASVLTPAHGQNCRNIFLILDPLLHAF